MELQEDVWDYPCSDDDLPKAGTTIGQNWVLEAYELEELYNKLDKKGILPLEWKCPGKRAPSPINFQKELETDKPQSPVKVEKTVFDFMDDDSSPTLRMRRQEGTLRGSAKKKTTSFDGVLSNLIRHKLIEHMEVDSQLNLL